MDKELSKEQKNKDFVQLYRKGIDCLCDLSMANPTAFRLFMFLMKNMDHSNALIVSNVVLQEVLGVGKATICRAVKYLRDNGWICILKSGTSNVYIANPEIAWTSYGNQKEYCNFEAQVILSMTENAEFLKNPKASAHYKSIDSDFVCKCVSNGSISC